MFVRPRHRQASQVHRSCAGAPRGQVKRALPTSSQPLAQFRPLEQGFLATNYSHRQFARPARPVPTVDLERRFFASLSKAPRQEGQPSRQSAPKTKSFLERAEEDEALEKELLGIDESANPAVSTEAQVLNDHGRLYFNNELYESALECYLAALSVIRRDSGKDTAESATLYINIAHVFQATKDYDKAEEYFRKSLAIRVAEYGDTDAMVASTMYKLASLCFTQGNSEEGLALLNKCQPILNKAIENEAAKLDFEFIKGDEERTKIVKNKVSLLEYDRAQVLNLIGTQFYKKADYAAAEKLFERAEAGFRTAYFELADNVVSDLQVANSNLVSTYQRLGKVQQAIKVCLNLANLLDKSAPTSSCGYVHALAARLFEATHQYREAEEHFGKALTIFKQIFGSSNDEVDTIEQSLRNLRKTMRTIKEKEALVGLEKKSK